MMPFRPYVPQEDHSAKVTPLGKCAVPRCTLKHSSFNLATAEPSTLVPPLNILQEQPRPASSSKALFLSSSPLDGNAWDPHHDNDGSEITKIKILPTTDEIICLKPVRMPEKTAGMSAKQLLDLHFRQLRYDSTEEIVDICYDALQQAVWSGKSDQFRHETPSGTRYSLFPDVHFKAFRYDHYDGAKFNLSFECPPSLRRFALLKSDLFQQGMMCSLLAIHKGTGEVNVIHLEAKERQPSNLDAAGTDNRATIQVVLADKNDVRKVQQATYYARGLILADFYLVSMSNVLLAGFAPVLRRLQACYQNGTFPLAETMVLPPGESEVSISPPKYAMDTGFKYNFSCLKTETSSTPDHDMVFESMHDREVNNTVIENLRQNTTLDDGQALALYENLSRHLALCQGPPGTGKTFLGVAEAKVILESRRLHSLKGHTKPIVVICMTNHALDDFLESLISNGVKKVVRLGNKSTNEWTLQYTLQKVVGEKRMSEKDRHTLRQLTKDSKDLASLGAEWAGELSGTPSLRILHDHLADNAPDMLAEFGRLDANTDISKDLKLLNKSSAARTFDYWLQGGDLKGLASLLDEGFADALSPLSMSSQSKGKQSEVSYRSPTDSNRQDTEISFQTSEASHTESAYPQALQKALEEFSRRCEKNVSTHKLWLLSLADREALVASWIKDLDQFAVCNKFADIHHRHQLIQQFRWDHSNMSDGQRIRDLGVQIVALTASAASQRWQFLDVLEPETYIIEEASELSEPFTIAGLVPSLQHIIKIGDPLQLRPHISSRILSTENDPRYRLDESLFERLMHRIPYSKLMMQRRAHPELANLLRAGCYPFLSDHPKTIGYPAIPGFQYRMFWLDHSRVEDNPDPGSALAKSFSNKYEARFIVEAVKYLVQHQGISMKQITVLTPYNGQVAQIAKHLQGFCKVLLSDSDRDSLMAMGVLSENDVSLETSVTKGVPLSSLVRLTTIDNYQGEENDIIFLSTVRSNANNKLGFLANQNRINVAISRARHAFYVVGNSSMISGKGTGWDPVIEVFKSQNRFGSSMPVSPCAKHVVETPITVDIDHPLNFQALPVCQAPCGAILSCGHQCTAACHADAMHVDGRLKCSQPCNKTLQCGHPCPSLCHEDCGFCTFITESVVLDCGHKANVPCSSSVANLRCAVVVLAYPGLCGHIRTKHCSTGLAPCLEQCTKPYPCGHECPNTCSNCEHTGCYQLCGKKLDCGHFCQSLCHHSTAESCPPCRQPCRKQCEHKRCNLACSEVCNPCTAPALAGHCTHQASALLCALPGSRIPCSEPCTLLAPCGLHPCQGLCGEKCPEVCDVCDGQPRRDGLFVLPCKCIFIVSELDVKFQMNKIYNMKGITVTKINVTSIPDKNCLECPTCGNPIVGSRRYVLCYQISHHNDLVGSLLMPLGRHLWKFMANINYAQIDLQKGFDKTCAKIRPGPLAIKDNKDAVTQALASIRNIRKEVERFSLETKTVQDALLAYSASLISTSDGEIVQGLPLARPNLPYLLRMERVLIRCDIIIFKYLLDLHTKVKAQGPVDSHLTVFLQVIQSNMNATLDHHVQSLPQLLLQCQSMQLKRLEVEFLIQRVCIVGMLRKLGSQTEIITPHIKRATELCKSHRSAGQLRFLVVNAERAMMSSTVLVKLDDALNGPKESPQGAAQFFWRNLALFKRGKLTTCASGHFYCGDTFSRCPECG